MTGDLQFYQIRFQLSALCLHQERVEAVEATALEQIWSAHATSLDRASVWIDRVDMAQNEWDRWRYLRFRSALLQCISWRKCTAHGTRVPKLVNPRTSL